MVTNFKNQIILKNYKLTVTAREENNVEYAFYLHHNEGIEKRFYTKQKTITFRQRVTDGLYKVTFFRRFSDQTVKFENEFLIVKNNCIVPKEKLAETIDYKICLYDNSSDVTFVVFNGADSTKNSPSFGLEFLLSKGYNVITCAQNANQYQGLSFSDFEEIVKPRIKNKKVYLYGSSLGGYCAVYYAGAVNGTVIAAAPRNSAHPDIILRKNSNKFKRENYKHQEIKDNRVTEMPVYIIVDPYVSDDMFFIEQFIKPAYPKNCFFLEFPYAGHEVLFHVNKIKKLSSIIDIIVSGSNPCLPELLVDEDSEFTCYGKALDSYKNMLFYIKKTEQFDSIHPRAEKQIQWLKNKLRQSF